MNHFTSNRKVMLYSLFINGQKGDRLLARNTFISEQEMYWVLARDRLSDHSILAVSQTYVASPGVEK